MMMDSDPRWPPQFKNLAMLFFFFGCVDDALTWEVAVASVWGGACEWWPLPGYGNAAAENRSYGGARGRGEPGASSLISVSFYNCGRSFPPWRGGARARWHGWPVLGLPQDQVDCLVTLIRGCQLAPGRVRVCQSARLDEPTNQTAGTQADGPASAPLNVLAHHQPAQSLCIRQAGASLAEA